MSEVKAVGHRVVHGGEYFSKATLVDDDVIKKIEKCNYLAPLHNPANIIGIKACMKLMPDTPNVVVFDTAFHQTMPESAYLYAIPRTTLCPTALTSLISLITPVSLFVSALITASIAS